MFNGYRLELNNCNFTGSLPAQWASGLPALQQINISSNLLTGGTPSLLACLHPPQVPGSLSLTTSAGMHRPCSWVAIIIFSFNLHVHRMQLYTQHQATPNG